MGATDSHASRPGSCGIPGDLWAPRAGITAVFAETLDRASIYEALKNRRCYATTGARMILEFSVNGQPMGSETGCAPGDERLIKGKVSGTAAVERVELLRDGEVVYRQSSAGRRENASFEYRDWRPIQAESCYYMRVMQADGHQAWSSPVWVEGREGGRS